MELTVGQVAGLIALGIFVAQIWVLNSLTYLLAGVLRDKETAATWSVASRALHSSLWPTVLASDSTLTQGVRSSVRGLTLGATVAAALISLASIVTPLGLYEDTASVTARTTTFRYARDNSSFGLGTGPQGVYPYSRLCSIGHGFAQGPAPCPYTGDQVVLSDNGEGLEWSFPNGTMTSKVPDIVRQIYSSGTIGTRTTVSNFFDIQWRQVGLFSQRFMDNGTAYPVDQFRMVDSLVLDGSYKIVEGLVVDALRGGVGFRNHTVPSGLTGTGAEWTEDLLFIEPESACVDTNLTIEFTINLTNRSLSRGIQDLVLVDRGGFANLDVDKYPEYDHPNAQANPDLWRRAYKAAVLNNAYTMFYLNVSNPANQTTNTSAFRYRNSRVGQEFRLNADSLETYKALDLTPQFGYYLFSSGTTGPRVNHSNPFGINKTELANVGISCSGAAEGDKATSNSIYVACGLIRGVPHRLDPRTGQPILSPVVVFDGGSRWSSPLHACASTVRTAIKTVTFRYNTTIAGPEHGLAGLRVVNITQRSYPTNEQAPLWGIEETGLDLDGVSPVWGLIDERYAEIANLTAKRAPHLYLVGLAAGTFAPGLHEALIGSAGYQNLPGADFPIYTMNTVYRNLASLPYDLTGKGSAAIFARWQQLSRTAETAQDIIHLAWTDLAASAVAGTKGVLGPLNGMRLSGGPADFASNGTAPPTSGDGTVTLPPAQQVDNIDFTVQVEVQPIVRRIKYRLPYAIPAFLVAAIMLGSIMAVAIFAVTGRSSFAAVSRRLRETSVGRVWRSILDPSRSNLAQPTKEWALLNAAEPVDVGPAPGNRNGAVVGTTAVYNGKLEHESAMNGYHSPSLYPRKPVASDNAYQ